MLKRSICLAVALIIALAAFTAFAEPTTYTFKETIVGDTDQGPVWYYMFQTDGNAVEELNYTPDWGDNWQQSKDPSGENIYNSIFDWNGFLAQSAKGVDMIVQFKAPEAGTYSIGEWNHYVTDSDRNTIDGKSMTVSIEKGSETVYSADTKSSVTYAGGKVDLKAGEILSFRVKYTAAGFDTLFVSLDDIAVTYEGPAASANNNMIIIIVVIAAVIVAAIIIFILMRKNKGKK